MRATSLLLCVLSLVLPSVFISYYTWSYDKWAAQQGGPVCGNPILAAWLLGALAAALLSCIAVVVGIRALSRVPRPRPARRVVEVYVLGLPFLVILFGWMALATQEWITSHAT